jgi:cation transport ATPase
VVLYFTVTFVILFLYGDRKYFCSPERTGQSYIVMTAKLALACTLWSLLASAAGTIGAKGAKHRVGSALFISTAVAGAGFFSISFWIYRGYGVFVFENTWADVSCFFTEGYGMVFPVLIAPMLTGLTLLQEWLALRRLKPSNG